MKAALERDPLVPTSGRGWVGDGGALLVRPRLLERLHAAVQGPLTVITAPAGYGKSVLVRQWAAEHETSPVTSVTFEADDDALRVAARLLVAGARLGADVGRPVPAWMSESGAVLGDAFLDSLFGWLDSIGDAVLVLDALDAPREVPLASGLERMATSLPGNLHAVVTRRSRWSAAECRTPLRRATVALDASDLAFTAPETRLLVRQLARRELTDHQLEALVARTEGWPVGLKVAAIALRDADDPYRVIEGLASERAIEAFLHEEVLDVQRPRVRRLLRQASVLDPLTASSCRALTGESMAPTILRVLEHSGAFIWRVPAEEETFAFHGLFRELLRRELRVSAPDAESDLLVRAAAWHVRRDEPELAVPYLVEAEDWDGLLALLDRSVPALFARGAVDEIVRWLDLIPGGGSRRRGELALRRAYALTMAGASRRAEQALRDVGAEAMSPGARVVVDVLRAAWAFYDAPPLSVIEAADNALEGLDETDPDEIPDVLGMTSPANLRMLAGASRGVALWYLGDVAASRLALSALTMPEGVYLPWHIRVLGALALLEAWDGNIRVAWQRARQALATAAAATLLDHPSTLDAHLAMAHVRRARGDLLRAGEALDRARRIAVRYGRPVSLAIARVERALWYSAAGNARLALAEIQADAWPTAPPIVAARMRAVEARLLVALGEIAQADAVVGAIPDELPDVFAAAVHAAIARGDLAGARARLDRWPVADGDRASGLVRQVWVAIVDFESGRRREAVSAAARLFADAHARGDTSVFLDAGRPGQRLLRALFRAAPTPELRQLLERLEGPGRPAEPAPLDLSMREQEVVRFLPTPLSSAEIAAQLYISLNTLKTHLRTIYRKLGVSSRRDAIRRAEELGIA